MEVVIGEPKAVSDRSVQKVQQQKRSRGGEEEEQRSRGGEEPVGKCCARPSVVSKAKQGSRNEVQIINLSCSQWSAL